jgi:pyruvate/2-oxoglutarate dehydrogenase complex dihydrolipoamide acyltransferase (E2) component
VGASINIPKLGWTMEEGTVTEWLAGDGATVAEGDPLYLLESDKVENEVAAPASGVLRQLATAGDTSAAYGADVMPVIW